MDEYGYNSYDSNSPAPQEGSKALSIVSLCLGIATIVLCCCNPCNIPLGIAAIVTGIIAKVKNKPGQGMALAGIICGAVGVLIAIIVLIYNIASGNFAKSFQDGYSMGYSFGNLS